MENSWRERGGSFGAAADVYDRSRPSYPVEAVRFALPGGAMRVLDLAAGTGKLTGVLLDLGLDVVAVEPTPEMRALLPPRAEILDGTAEAIPLPDASVDAVLVGQAFHWFDEDVALKEIARVLRPGGTLGLLWNLREVTEPWVDEVWGLFESASIEDASGESASGDSDAFSDTQPPTAPFEATEDFEPASWQHFPNAQQLDPDLLVDLVASRSGVIVLPVEQRVEVLQRTRALAPSDSFELRYRTEAWCSVRRGPTA